MLIIRDQNNKIIDKRDRKFTLLNIIKIAKAYDAEIRKTEIHLKHAILIDRFNHWIFVDII